MQVLGSNVYGDYTSLEFQDVQHEGLMLGPDDLLIEIHYTDVNPVDLQKLAGRPHERGNPVPNPPHIPGYGGTGRVVDGGANGYPRSKGQWVCFLADPSRRGTYSTQVVVHRDNVAPIHHSSERSLLRAAAAIPVAGLTAYESLIECGIDEKSSEGESTTKSLLVIGGAGGVGSWTITLARVMNEELQIFATASAESQKQWCLTLGANHVMDHSAIEENLEGGKTGSIDAIICLTEPTPELFASMSNIIRPHGTICLVVAGKSIESLNLGFCFFKSVNVATETVFSSIRAGKPTKHKLGRIVQWIQEQKILAPLSPDLEDGCVSENFADACKENGVLKALSTPHGRRGKYIMRIA